jgi:hypothetical protein
MRTRFVIAVAIPAIILVFCVGTAGAQGKEDFKAKYDAIKGSAPADPHDLSGVWEMTVLDHTLGTPPPPLTEAGKKAMKGRIGDTPGVPRAIVNAVKDSPDVHFASGPVRSNAPWLQCNPEGFPRLLNDDEPMEMITTKDKILQVYQWEGRIRYLWTDGRQVPSGQNLENLGPAWYGHSVGKWEGDTLVVQTVGLDERAWLDNLGYPKSFHARIEERWKLLDSNTMEFQLTLYDPEYYTAPYVGSKKTFKRVPDDSITYSGWKGLFAGISEGICAPMNEVEGYDKGFQALGDKK